MFKLRRKAHRLATVYVICGALLLRWILISTFESTNLDEFEDYDGKESNLYRNDSSPISISDQNFNDSDPSLEMLGRETEINIREAQAKLRDEGIKPKHNDWRVSTEDASKVLIIGTHMAGSDFLGHLLNSNPGTFYRY